jgi:holo-[acyl-carrier protein] synthase
MGMRVGIDLVSVEAVRESIRDHGERYLKRIYTEGELRDCHTEQGPVPERLAARFAAKEATLKVLRPVDEAIPWRSMEVVRHGAGWVTMELNGRAAILANEARLTNFELSICHEAGYASAIVIAELDLSNR